MYYFYNLNKIINNQKKLNINENNNDRCKGLYRLTVSVVF